MNYNYIVNPLTNRKCNINSKLGKKILNIYANQIGGTPDLGAFQGITYDPEPKRTPHFICGCVMVILLRRH